jgi:uncharacterized membrane protein YphA (DoxX/SURF4 family)
MFDSFATRYQKFAPIFLRIGLALVFIFFSIQKLSKPGQGTAEVQLLLNVELADAAAINYYLGIVEFCIAASFILGFKVRIFALISSVMIVMFFVSFLAKYGISINPDLYRDVGLIGASIALFLLGAGPMSLDTRTPNKEKNEQVS